MKWGTPGFVGERLRQAREARGLTAISLAHILGISRAAISQYENGSASPQPSVMDRIAERLNLPVSYFLIPRESASSRAVFFRSLAAATKAERGRGNSRIEWLSEIVVPYFRTFVSFPRVNVPSISSSPNPSDLDGSDIEDIALEVREWWGLGDGPISNVVLLLENNGILVVRIDLQAATLDAFSTWYSVDNTPYVILGQNKGSAVRSRFDAAHELGHLVMHRNVDKSRLKSSSDFKLIEAQANRFASAFLVPQTRFGADYSVPTLNAFLPIKTKWLVSVGVLIKRSEDLGFISRDHAQRLWVNYNRHGWRRSEPQDDRIPVEQPVLLRRACELVINEGVRTPERILADIPLAQHDVEEFVGVSHDHLRPRRPPLDLRDRQDLEAEYQSALHEAERILNQHREED